MEQEFDLDFDSQNDNGDKEAISYCNEDEKGRLVVANDEYASIVNYCPFCGYKARFQVKG